MIEYSSPRMQVAFTRAVTCAKNTCQSMADHAAIDKAIGLVLTGKVSLQVGHALVQSETRPGVTYRVSSTCTCPARRQAGQVGCKHLFAAWLVHKSLKIAATLPAPLRWHAQWFDQGRRVEGIAEEWVGILEHVWFLPEDGTAPRWTLLHATVLGDLVAHSQCVAAMRAVPVQDCAAF